MLTIDDGVIRFEGKVLPLGSELLEPWEEALGPARHADVDWHVWDEHGLSVQYIRLDPQVPRKFVTGLRVHFGRNHFKLDGFRRYFGPHSMFSGTLLLDGTRVHPKMRRFPTEKPCRFVRGRPYKWATDCDLGPLAFACSMDDDDNVKFFEVGVRVMALEELWTTGELPPIPSTPPAPESPWWWPF